MIATLKKCIKCKKEKPESEFHTDRSRPDGLKDWCKECIRKYNQKRKRIRRDQRLEREFGFLPGDLKKISKSQDAKCLICGQVKKLDVDHCHKTYNNRGLLCNSCNTKLGWYEKHPIQEYLNKPEWKFCLVWLSPRNRRDYKFRSRYNICLDDFEMMSKSQNEVCGICFKPCATDNNLCVDHDYQTLRVRGLLCMSCNTKLGWFENNPVLEYLV